MSFALIVGGLCIFVTAVIFLISDWQLARQRAFEEMQFVAFFNEHQREWE